MYLANSIADHVIVVLSVAIWSFCGVHNRKICTDSFLWSLLVAVEIEHQFAPTILDMAEAESVDDFKTEAVTVMSWQFLSENLVDYTICIILYFIEGLK